MWSVRTSIRSLPRCTHAAAKLARTCHIKRPRSVLSPHEIILAISDEKQKQVYVHLLLETNPNVLFVLDENMIFLLWTKATTSIINVDTDPKVTWWFVSIDCVFGGIHRRMEAFGKSHRNCPNCQWLISGGLNRTKILRFAQIHVNEGPHLSMVTNHQGKSEKCR